MKRMQRDGIITFAPYTPRSITLNKSYNHPVKRISSNNNTLLHCSFKFPDKGRLVSVVAIIENDKGQALPPVRAIEVHEDRCEVIL